MDTGVVLNFADLPETTPVLLHSVTGCHTSSHFHPKQVFLEESPKQYRKKITYT